jgi:phosphoglycolate phosphatase
LLIIFDLDGTLIDSAQDLAVSTNATRAHFGLSPLDPQIINSYVGNGASVLIKRAMGPDASEAVVAEALAFFLRYYRAHALEHTHFYPGIRESIDELSQRGHYLSVLTNKPVRISRDILASLGVGPLFSWIYGGDSFAAKKPDPIGVSTLLSQTETESRHAVMVGDSAVDVQTARNAGIRSIGVTWGFQPEGFESFPPDLLVSCPRDLVRALDP